MVLQTVDRSEASDLQDADGEWAMDLQTGVLRMRATDLQGEGHVVASGCAVVWGLVLPLRERLVSGVGGTGFEIEDEPRRNVRALCQNGDVGQFE
jgi:hypothetical protein